jgi:hypothetical protein
MKTSSTIHSAEIANLPVTKTFCDICSRAHGNTDFRLASGGSVIDAVTRHADDMAGGLQAFDG